MTIITHNRRRSRLSTLIDQPGGISVGIALAQARDNLATLATRSVETIEAEARALTSMAAPQSLDENILALNQAYKHSSAIIDAACPYEMPGLCAAASNLCDLLDTASEEEIFDWRVVTVHAQAIRLLLHLDKDAAEAREQVLNSLKDVLKVKSAQTAQSETD